MVTFIGLLVLVIVVGLVQGLVDRHLAARFAEADAVLVETSAERALRLGGARVYDVPGEN